MLSTNYIRSWPGTVLLIILLPLAAPAEASRTFKQAYADYQQAVAAEHPPLIRHFAEEALTLAQAVLPDDSPTLAALSLNLGNAQLTLRERRALRTLSQTLRRFERAHGAEAPELIDPLIALGYAEHQEQVKSNGHNRFARALEIAAQHFAGDIDLLIQINSDIGSELLARKSRESRAYLTQALALTTEHYPTGAEELIKPEIWMGRYHLADGNYPRAEQFFRSVVRQFDKLPGGKRTALALANRALLVTALEYQEQPDAATREARQIGAQLSWRDNALQEPIYRAPIAYPESSQDQAGSMLVEFALTPNGTVENPRMVEIEGARELTDAVLESFARWRFAPRTVKGKPQHTDGVRSRVIFDSSRAYGSLAFED